MSESRYRAHEPYQVRDELTEQRLDDWLDMELAILDEVISWQDRAEYRVAQQTLDYRLRPHTPQNHAPPGLVR